MRIWCCLCFIGEDYDDKLRERDMKEGFFGNVGDNERNTGNDNDPEGGAATQLELSLNQPGRGEDPLRLFEEMITAIRGSGNNWDDASWQPAFRCSRPAEGESSGSALAAAAEDSDLDSHHKRAKVYSSSHCHFATPMPSDVGTCSSSADREFSIGQSSSVSSNNGIFYHNFLLNNGSDENPFDANGEKDDGSGSESSRMEDCEVNMDLTDDLLHMVFTFLDHINLCRAAMVCRQWRAASAHEDFWRCLNFESRNISLEQFEDMCRRYPNAAEVNIYGTPNIHILVMKAISSLRNLEALTLGRGQVGDTFFHALADCNMLKSLNVNDATLGNGIQEIPINHDRLRYLKITKCRVMRLTIRCPQLKNLSLKRSNMAQAALNCPLLRLLDISSCHKLSDAAIRSAATSCSQLESLDMSNCSCVSDETLREISGACANLHVLNASYCPNISLESVRLPMLTVLKLHSCEGITSASMAAIAYSSVLEVLELDNCNLLTSVSLDLPRLQNIRLVHCRKYNSIPEPNFFM